MASRCESDSRGPTGPRKKFLVGVDHGKGANNSPRLRRMVKTWRSHGPTDIERNLALEPDVADGAEAKHEAEHVSMRLRISSAPQVKHLQNYHKKSKVV